MIDLPYIEGSLASHCMRSTWGAQFSLLLRGFFSLKFHIFNVTLQNGSSLVKNVKTKQSLTELESSSKLDV